MSDSAITLTLKVVESLRERVLRLEEALREANISIPSIDVAKARSKARFDRLNPKKRLPVVRLR